MKYMEVQPTEKVSTNLFLPTFASSMVVDVCFRTCVRVFYYFLLLVKSQNFIDEFNIL